QRAIHEMESRAKLKGMILDLRSNPGGLLDAACQVSDLFLDRGQLIVSAMGKSVPRTDYVARTSATFARDYPLLVMINGASASASEIVAGALQDWDRGLVVGLNSFGKGSVQRLFPDMAVSDRTYNQEDTGALKLTTSYYYTPSGRCIQRKKFDSKDFMESMGDMESDSLPESHFESMPLESLPRFSTLALGREVLGGGGIHPDFKVEERDFSDLALVLSGKASFFHYAMQELPKGEIALSYRADRQETRKFRSFLRKQEYDLDEFGEEDFEKERDFIASRIRFEMLYNQFGLKEAVRAGIGDDWELQEALRLIRKHKTLDGLLEAEESQP
ncbi:MAG: S41 family peptidase, partial [Candidatus Krumholzibacteria bacterium]|nr:S41 family peptidase [Candidatus Krumholzibacteria bacterium]